jgi:hypothetical protein
VLGLHPFDLSASTGNPFVTSHPVSDPFVDSMQDQIAALCQLVPHIPEHDVAEAFRTGLSMGLSVDDVVANVLSTGASQPPSTMMDDDVVVISEGSVVQTPYGDGVVTEGIRSDGFVSIHLGWGTVFCHVGHFPANFRFEPSSLESSRSDSSDDDGDSVGEGRLGAEEVWFMCNLGCLG